MLLLDSYVSAYTDPLLSLVDRIVIVHAKLQDLCLGYNIYVKMYGIYVGIFKG
jgi:hypothetical protein